MSTKQKYRDEWETMPENQKWLGRSANKMGAHCKACQTDILSRLASLKQHAATQKHKDNMKFFCAKSKIQSFFKDSDKTLAASIIKAEIMFTAAIAEHNISMRAMDHISDVIKHAFPDSAIAQGFNCKRTKTASLTYNVLAPVMKEQLISSMKRCVSAAGRPVFSIIIDE